MSLDAVLRDENGWVDTPISTRRPRLLVHDTPTNPAKPVARSILNNLAGALAKGVAIKPKIGIDLSSRTGFTTTARRKVDFAKAGKLCGVSGVPAGSPGLLVVK